MRRFLGVTTPARLLYGGLGWCAVALAIAGVIVPGLPTTVFVLAASYCFSRSSSRFERWLRENRWLGPPLQRFARGGGMPPSAKRATLIAMWTAILLSSGVLAGTHRAAALGVIGMGGLGTLSILFGVRTVREINTPPSCRRRSSAVRRSRIAARFPHTDRSGAPADRDSTRTCGRS
jgi:uncharacterized membrane protein YbaN (DUF454 family)